MKRFTSTIVFFMIFLIGLSGILFYAWVNKKNVIASKTVFQKQLGTYILDVDKTQMASYTKDTAIYSKLTITFDADSTFSLNMKVPFLYDSIGRWISGEGVPEDWNWLFFKGLRYPKYEANYGSEFTEPWTSDSIFYINGATPQKGEEFIQEIYFKKIKASKLSSKNP